MFAFYLVFKIKEHIAHIWLQTYDLNSLNLLILHTLHFTDLFYVQFTDCIIWTAIYSMMKKETPSDSLSWWRGLSSGPRSCMLCWGQSANYNLPLVLGQTKSSWMTSTDIYICTQLRGIWGPSPGARPGEGAHQRAPGGRAFTHGAQLDI